MSKTYQIAETIQEKINDLQTLQTKGMKEIPDALFFKRAKIHQEISRLLNELPEGAKINLEK